MKKDKKSLLFAGNLKSEHLTMFGSQDNKHQNIVQAPNKSIQGKTKIQSEAYLEKECSSIPREIVLRSPQGNPKP